MENYSLFTLVILFSESPFFLNYTGIDAVNNFWIYSILNPDDYQFQITSHFFFPCLSLVYFLFPFFDSLARFPLFWKDVNTAYFPLLPNYDPNIKEIVESKRKCKINKWVLPTFELVVSKQPLYPFQRFLLGTNKQTCK